MLDDILPENDNRAVSPVIGVILMVAITVILAAVIAAFVMGIGPGGAPVQASIDVTEDDGDIEVFVENADNINDIEVRNCENFDSGPFSLVDGSNSGFDGDSLDDVSIASSVTIDGDSDAFTSGDFSDPDDGCGGDSLNFVGINDDNDQILTNLEHEGDS